MRSDLDRIPTSEAEEEMRKEKKREEKGRREGGIGGGVREHLDQSIQPRN